MRYIENIFNNASVAKNGYTDSKAIPIAPGEAPLWKFAIQSTFTSTGAATIKLEVLTSPDGETYYNLDTDIDTGMAKDTNAYKGFTPTLCVWLKIRATEENTAAVTGLYADLLIG